MHRILTTTPFGFVVELLLDCCYRVIEPFQIYVDGVYHSTSIKLVTSLFGLKPDTVYKVEFKGLTQPLNFFVQTEKAAYVLNVREYNAIGDGCANDTSAINAAIYTAPSGAVVRLPRGIYLVDQILLKSGVDLYFEDGAVLRQNTNRDSLSILKGYQKNYDFTGVTINASWEGHPLDCFCSLIYGKEVEKVCIYGHGILDGSGEQGGWWVNPKRKNRAYRPRNVMLVSCRDITFVGIASKNSASWNIHPFYSENLKFYDLNISSDPNSPNTDGLNPESCENVQIVGCRFQVGDDCIAIKAGKFYMSMRHLRPSHTIRIRNCFMEQGHGGVVIGSEMSCGVKDVEISQCLFEKTDRGLRIKTRRGRGETGVIESIRLSRVEMVKVAHCVVINMFYNCDPDGHSDYVKCKTPLPLDEGTPSIKNITLFGINATDIAGSAVFIYGLPESKVTHVTISDNSFDFLPNRACTCADMMDDPILIEDIGVFMENVENIHMQNNKFTGYYVNSINELELKK